MATLVIDEKQGMPAAPLTVTTTALSKQSSSQSLDIPTLTPSAEKNGLSAETTRDSGVSTPCSAHHGNPFDTDIEAIISHPTSEQKSKDCARGRPESCQVWPGQEHWRQKAKAAKMKRTCGCLAHLSPRNRVIVKILIGLLVIGVAVGVGLGISKPLGTGVWHKNS
ncbi:hypothetical protein NKR23_g5097 [Pleurostoma richardsiae]|uniref:Uncharacterized protein n=1 Tax=Pleurostoma richardsiae TaxID=41990 RepID=A0AA38RUP1_9PEZI|nr:hypothetical protein NKR23_g5097 [Pleurostoma richardsiae]